jgi:LPXTG-site transpeptidase (sortase) family protein
MHSRRVLAIAVSVVLMMPSTAIQAMGFVDLDGSPYEPAILALAGEGIVSGYPDGTTRPYGRLNRAEALKVIVAAQKNFSQELGDTKSNMPTIPLFSDVEQSAWYAPYLEVAFSNKVITGYPDNLFRPQSNLKTEEAIAIALRAYNIQGVQEFQTSPNIDNYPGEWFTPYVNAAIQRNLLDTNSRMQLGSAITRGQFFTMVQRIRTGGAPQVAVISVSSSQPSVQAYLPTPQQGSQASVAPVFQQPVVQPQAVQQQPQQQIIPQAYAQAQPQPSSSQVAVRRAQHTGVVNTATALQFASAKDFAISIPSLGIVDLTVTHPDNPTTQKGVLAPLQVGVGHLFAYPGEGSKIMIYGHSSGYPWDLSQFTKIFRTINKVAVGERIYVTYNGNLYVYEVVLKNAVAVKDTTPFEPDENGEELILYTCWPPDTISQRYLVHAMPIDVVALR